MTDRAALLAAIRANPDEDTPRLAYADFLDEHGAEPPPVGAPRPDRFTPAERGAFEAEYIRVQCRLAQHPFDAPDYVELLHREFDLARLLHLDDPQRLTELPGLSYDRRSLEGIPTRYRWGQYRRGLLDELAVDRTWEMTTADIPALEGVLEAHLKTHPARTLGVNFRADLGALAAFLKLPVLEAFRGLTIDREGDDNEATEADEVLRLVAASPRLAKFQSLELVTPFTGEGLRALAGARFDHLTRLKLKSAGLGAAGVLALAAAPWSRRIRELSLNGDSWYETVRVNDETFAAIGRLDAPDLVSLHIESVSPGPAAVAAFTRAKLPRLGKLSFDYAGLGPGGVEALTKARGWPLRDLDLTRCYAGAAGAKALAAWPLADGLRALCLRNNNLSGTAVKGLCASPRFAGLRHLDLSANPLGRVGIAALAKSKHLRGLRALHLYVTQGHGPNSRATVADGAAFVAALDMPELRHFHNWGIPVGARGTRTIARSPKFAHLTQLTLEDAAVPDAAARELIEAPQLQGLIGLNLCSNDLSDGLKPLTRKGVLPRLARLELTGNTPDAGLLKRLRQRPGVEIY